MWGDSLTMFRYPVLHQMFTLQFYHPLMVLAWLNYYCVVTKLWFFSPSFYVYWLTFTYKVQPSPHVLDCLFIHSSTHLLIHSSIHSFLSLWTWILLNELQSITIFTYFAAHIIPDLASGSPFKLSPVSFQYVPVILWVLSEGDVLLILYLTCPSLGISHFL